MTSLNETLTFDGTALNDQNPWSLESFTFAPPSKRLQRLSAADADADILAEAARYELRVGTARVRYEGGAGMDAFLDAVNALSGKLQRCEELDDGSPLVWTPATSTHTSTIYVQSGEVTDLPMVLDGDDSGWFVSNPRPVITVRFDCFPFLEKAEYLAATATGSGRLLAVEVPNIGGTVPAKSRVVITDGGSATRKHVEVGGDRYGYNAASPSDLDLTYADLTALAGTGVSSTYFTYDVGATPIGICEAAGIPHTGPHNVRVQFEQLTGSAPLCLRAAVRTVDGPWKYTPWQRTLGLLGKCDLLLGQVDFDPVERGSQLSTVRIEAMTSDGIATTRIYRINLMPTEVVYAVMRAVRTGAPPSAFPILDGFNQSAGNLAGKTADTGGTWAGTGDSDDFAVETTGKTAQRTAVSDSSVSNGRFAILGSSTYSEITAQLDVKFSAVSSSPGIHRYGILLRYVDTSNWLGLVLIPASVGGILAFVGRVAGSAIDGSAGVFSLLEPSASSPYIALPATWYRLKAVLDSRGNAYGWVGFASYGLSAEPTITVENHPDLATGGALASGKVGMYDAHTTATAATRNFDKLVGYAPTDDVPLYSGRSLEIAHDHAVRENSGGTGWAPVPSYRGRRLWLPPAGPGNKPTRLVFKDRTTDVDSDVDSGADKARTIDVYVAERTLVAP